MSVRAKFRVIGNTEGTVRLEPVTGGSSENDSFFRYTPSGKIDLTTVNEAAAEQFAVGKEFYVDFTPAE